jgi:hypothetical protein
MHTSPPRSNFSKKNAPGIASDVAIRCAMLKWVLGGHRWRQRWWETMPTVSDSVSQKKISRSEVEREWGNSYFCYNLSIMIFWGACRPAMNYCRKLLQAYPPIEMYQKNPKCNRFAAPGLEELFPVVLLCQFLVQAGNRIWFYILLMYLCTGFRQNTLAKYTSGYIVGTCIISD